MRDLDSQASLNQLVFSNLNTTRRATQGWELPPPTATRIRTTHPTPRCAVGPSLPMTQLTLFTARLCRKVGMRICSSRCHTLGINGARTSEKPLRILNMKIESIDWVCLEFGRDKVAFREGVLG